MGGDANLFRQIPPMDHLLGLPAVQKLIGQTSRSFIQEQLNLILNRLRAGLSSRDDAEVRSANNLLKNLETALGKQISSILTSRLQRVINATGVVIHTNLGRSPLGLEVAQAVSQVAQGYSNLEFDLLAGRRGHRDEIVEPSLCSILGCESATVVNNNAAAVFLVLSELAAGGEVIVSRGELMEIGGSFRIPEILRQSHAILREVGTTNKTRLSDYAAAIGEETRLLLKVHPSNYRLVGFTQSVSIPELVPLAREHKIPLVEDAGSGLLNALPGSGIEEEPLITASLAAGADLVTFSGDKLLGGPQAGIIAGRRNLISRIRRHPLMRVVRPDKMTLAALEATLKLYLSGTEEGQIPVLGMIREEKTELRRHALALRRRVRRAASSDWNFDLHETQSVVGGGSCPGIQLPTWAVAVSSRSIHADKIEKLFRSFKPPILTRLEENSVLLDVRTLLPGDDAHLVRFFASHHRPADSRLD